MAEDPLRPDLLDPAAHGLAQVQESGPSGDEIIMRGLKRFGPLLLILALGISVLLGYGAQREAEQDKATAQGSQYLAEALKILFEDPIKARAILQAPLERGDFEELPLKPWLEFIIVRSQIIEGQRAYAAGGPPPEEALVAVEKFLSQYDQHRELAPLGWLAKAALLEDLGRHIEANAALGQAQFINPDSAAGIFIPLLSERAQQRQQLWDKFLQRLNP